jgi:TonB family protein
MKLALLPLRRVALLANVSAWAACAAWGACVASTGCSGGGAAAPRFVPAPHLPAEPSAPPDQPGRPWLDLVHARLHPAWAETFLEQARNYLPPGHPLNDLRLEVTLRITVDGAGKVLLVEALRSSGLPDFDAAARDVVQGASPVPAPPEDLRSDDGQVYLEWRFARDARQDAVVGARVERRLWEPARAVPSLLAAGRWAQAAVRVADAATAPPSADAAMPLLGLGRRVAAAVLLAAAADDKEPEAQLDAVAALGAVVWDDALPLLRRLAAEAPDLVLQAGAIRALGALGDSAAIPMMAEAVARLDGDRSQAAAEALVRLGKGSLVWAAAAPHLGAGEDPRARGEALAALSDAGEPASIPALGAILRDKTARRGDRAAAARALGAAAADAAGPAARALVAALADSDAAIRAAAAEGLARAGERGARSRALLAATLDRLGDRDPTVRAAAVVAAAALDPRAALSEVLLAAARARDAGVESACAAALGRIPGAEALAGLGRLAASPRPEVRLAALRALVRRPEAEARAALARRIGDEDSQVRELAAGALADPAAAEAALGDEAPEVRAAALRAYLRKSGSATGLATAMRALAASRGPRERVLLARAFLEAGHGR